jgi:eukaryotic-like serine/threonine-protein kinase
MGSSSSAAGCEDLVGLRAAHTRNIRAAPLSTESPGRRRRTMPPAPVVDSPEARIGPYRVVRRLGVGGMGEVFLAYDDRLDRLVAIKRMRPEALRDPSRRERLRREARAAARLSHPNVVQVYDLEEDEERGDAIVLEYVQGQTIAELLRAGPLPAEQAVELAGQVAEGLAAAHSAGLVHRDLKAENVVVTAEGRAKILDFGLVKPLDPGADSTVTEHGAVLGTYRAMAPEQAEGGEVDARADLFSLGVLLYEMLAGRSPFQGATPVATLRNLTGAAPRQLEEVRTDLPDELTGLIDSLLEKDPDRRPAGAREVVARLRGTTSTGSAAVLARSIPLSHPKAEREETSALSTLRRPRRTLLGGLVALVLLAAASAWIVTETGLGRREPLRVAVPKPVMAEGTEGLDLAASGALVAALRTLISFEGVTPVDPSQIGEVRGAEPEVARAVAAEEVLTLTIEPSRPHEAFVFLRRIRAGDGSVLWAERLAVPVSRDGALPLAEGISGAVRRAYPEQQVRAGIPDLDVRAADYTEFVEIWQRLKAGKGAWAPELARLEAITGRSPRFLEAYVQAAPLGANLFLDTRDPSYLKRARAAQDRARALAPKYPRVLFTETMVALAERKFDRVEQALAVLERELPGDPAVTAQRARLADAQGDLVAAIRLLRGVVERYPSWRYLVELADLELRTGEVGPARHHLKEAALLVPGNTWPLAKLGELELYYGNLRRAEEIYRDLVAAGPQRSDLTNLGIVRFMLRDYAGAVESYRRALEIEPGHVTVLLNLADAELARGRRDEALNLYRQLSDLLGARDRLLPVERCFLAQCLAHLGEGQRAVEMALEVLQRAPQDAEVTYQAAVVFTLAGEDASALAMARKARELGIQPRWLRIPAFEALRVNSTFQALLAEKPKD